MLVYSFFFLILSTWHMVHTYTHTQLHTKQPHFMCRPPSYCSLVKPNGTNFQQQ